jgi:hypothetical protein
VALRARAKLPTTWWLCAGVNRATRLRTRRRQLEDTQLSDTAPPDRFQQGWLDRLDGRYALARDLRARFQALTDDLGGAANLSYAERALAEHALWLDHWLHEQERALAEGRMKDFDVGRWTQGLNALSGVLTKLGLKRVPKDVPDLSQWLRKREQAA